MEGHLDLREAASAAPAPDGPLSALGAAFRAALTSPDVRGARRLIGDAADRGASPGRLYVEVVRPALAALQGFPQRAHERLAVGIGESILADLVGRLPVMERRGTGRAAILTCREEGIEAVDGSVAMDFLEVDGWSVERLHGSGGAPAASTVARDGVVELAVAVTAGPEDAMRLAPVCTSLRRLADPPVILLCDFSGAGPQRSASSAVGADATAHDPQDLVAQAALRSPQSGQRRWGVRISRSGQTLVLAPTGRLDATSVGRLLDVAATRQGSFSTLAIDLRDLAAIDAAGVRELAGWPLLASFGEAGLVLLGGAPVQRALRATGVLLSLPLQDRVL